MVIINIWSQFFFAKKDINYTCPFYSKAKGYPLIFINIVYDNELLDLIFDNCSRIQSSQP